MYSILYESYGNCLQTIHCSFYRIFVAVIHSQTPSDRTDAHHIKKTNKGILGKAPHIRAEFTELVKNRKLRRFP